VLLASCCSSCVCCMQSVRSAALVQLCKRCAAETLQQHSMTHYVTQYVTHCCWASTQKHFRTGRLTCNIYVLACLGVTGCLVRCFCIAPLVSDLLNSPGCCSSLTSLVGAARVPGVFSTSSKMLMFSPALACSAIARRDESSGKVDAPATSDGKMLLAPKTC
jgi:hypothetical protein